MHNVRHPELSDEELDKHARISHHQMSGEGLKKMIQELSRELEADTVKGRKKNKLPSKSFIRGIAHKRTIKLIRELGVANYLSPIF